MTLYRLASFSGGILMRSRLALLLAAAISAAPGCAAAFEAYVAAVMPLRVSPSSDARPVTTMAANIPVQCPGLRPLVPGAIWRDHGLCPGAACHPRRAADRARLWPIGIFGRPRGAARRGARPAQRRLCAARRLRLWLDAVFWDVARALLRRARETRALRPPTAFSSGCA